jgi:hypothetical protein
MNNLFPGAVLVGLGRIPPVSDLFANTGKTTVVIINPASGGNYPQRGLP